MTDPKRRAYAREYYKANRERVLERNRKYAAANRAATNERSRTYPVDVIASAMFVETNGGELEPIADVYQPRGCALYIIDRLKKAGWTITHPDPF